MNQNRLAGWSKRRLRLALAIFFLALVIPTTILVFQASGQMKWEAFHQQRSLAEELVVRIERRYLDFLELENARPFTDYSFLNVIEGGGINPVQRSPLSAYPLSTPIPGIIGYFQVDNTGQLSSPLLPENIWMGKKNALSSADMLLRKNVTQKIYRTLKENKLISPLKDSSVRDLLAEEQQAQESIVSAIESEDKLSPESRQSTPGSSVSQYGFDQLQGEKFDKKTKQQYPGSLGRVEDLKLESRFDSRVKGKSAAKQKKTYQSKRPLRKERNVLPAQKSPSPSMSDTSQSKDDIGISIFESEVDALEISLLESGHFVLYRKVWRAEQRYIQGMLIDAKAFIAGVIDNAYQASLVSRSSNLVVAFKGNVLSVLKAKPEERSISNGGDLQDTLLLNRSLASTLSPLQLIFSVNYLPVGPGGVLVGWLSVVILMVLIIVFFLIYRLGVKQINLAQQQQDFVSAVSHELKTPLTSIRMYGEMLCEGWVNEEKRKDYYEFIYDESERLTRLINNVLQLARMTRNDVSPELKSCSVTELLDIAQSKMHQLVSQHDFVLTTHTDPESSQASVLVDVDYFTQILINLIDNAIKFSKQAEKKQIDIGCRLYADKLQFYVRDYGPGIEKNQMKKIFNLFYRSENELTRESVGTGIGLALVYQLAHSMQASVNVLNRTPGAEFTLSFSLQ